MKIKLQSAMEYLMTYGWAILVIAIVLGALASLGILNPYTFAPKAQPGSCQVYRPYGQGSNQYVSLVGTCTNMLPEYVAQFNGQNSYINIPTFPSQNKESISILIWASPTIAGSGTSYSSSNVIIYEGSSSNSIQIAYQSNFDININGWLQNGESSSNAVPLHSWSQIAFIQNSSSGIVYINGVPSGTMSTNGNAAEVDPTLSIGSSLGKMSPYNFIGYIANVQIYNTSLSANEIQALYQEGIGGAPIDLQHLVGWWPLNGNANEIQTLYQEGIGGVPIDLQHLVGWWPLNGNANDYSGNGNNGQANNIIWVSTWESSYTPP